jgi:hypothetical protein
LLGGVLAVDLSFVRQMIGIEMVECLPAGNSRNMKGRSVLPVLGLVLA